MAAIRSLALTRSGRYLIYIILIATLSSFSQHTKERISLRTLSP